MISVLDRWTWGRLLRERIRQTAQKERERDKNWLGSEWEQYTETKCSRNSPAKPCGERKKV
jgi:hypothetical protein